MRFRAAETAVAAAFAVMVMAAGSVPAEAEQRAPPRIDSFGPYKVGMPLADAKKADPNAKVGACAELAENRHCLIVKAAVFEEPAVIYAVLDEKRERVDKVIAKLDPKLSRRRAYRCIRLSEKVFALLVVVYGSKYKQQYDANKRPLPAVPWTTSMWCHALQCAARTWCSWSRLAPTGRWPIVRSRKRKRGRV